MHLSFAIALCVAFGCLAPASLATTYTTYIVSGYYGTASHVMIRFIGGKGTSKTHYLMPRGGFTSFGMRRFSLSDRDIGAITAVEVAVQTPNTGPAWILNKVLIRPTGSKPYVFTYNDQVPRSGWLRIQMKCPRGYQRGSSGSCQDIDECATSSPCIGPIVTCRNTIGSYRCECPRGYRVLWNQKCQDINECKLGTSCEQGCVNTPGSYQCTCKPGYKVVDGYKCRDLDECAEGKDGCDRATTTCKNFDYASSGRKYVCKCKPGYQVNTYHDCRVWYCDPSTIPSHSTYTPAVKCSKQNQIRYNDTCELVCDHGYVPYKPAYKRRTCGPKGNWIQPWTFCVGRTCPALQPVPHGDYHPAIRCHSTGGQYDSSPDWCRRRCNSGYDLIGNGLRKCQADGTWTADNSYCKKSYPKPYLYNCPLTIIRSLEKGQSTYALGDDWKEPTSNVNITVQPTGVNRFYRFPPGVSKITWTAVNGEGKNTSCYRHVMVEDKEAPEIKYCPGPVVYYPTNKTSGIANYAKPTFTDNLGIKSVTPAYTGGYAFKDRTQNGIQTKYMTYRATDTSSNGNTATCEFKIVLGGRCYAPDSIYPGYWQCSNFGRSFFCIRKCPNGTHYFASSTFNTYFICGDIGQYYKYVPADCVGKITVKTNETCRTGYAKGTWKDAGANDCYQCPIGTYYENSQCKKCPSGKYQDQRGETSCKTCPIGTSPVDEATRCRPHCPAGTFSRDGARPFCQLCPSGQYQPSTGRKTCLSCAQTTNTKYGATVCGGAVTSPAAAPVIDRLVTPGNVTKAQDNTLECYIRDNAYEQVSVTWKIEGDVPDKFLGNPKLTELTNGAGKPIGARLVLRSATRYDANVKYVCEATNPHGQTRQEVTLKWYSPWP